MTDLNRAPTLDDDIEDVIDTLNANDSRLGSTKADKTDVASVKETADAAMPKSGGRFSDTIVLGRRTSSHADAGGCVFIEKATGTNWVIDAWGNDIRIFDGDDASRMLTLTEDGRMLWKGLDLGVWAAINATNPRFHEVNVKNGARDHDWQQVNYKVPSTDRVISCTYASQQEDGYDTFGVYFVGTGTPRKAFESYYNRSDSNSYGNRLYGQAVFSKSPSGDWLSGSTQLFDWSDQGTAWASMSAAPVCHQYGVRMNNSAFWTHRWTDIGNSHVVALGVLGNADTKAATLRYQFHTGSVVDFTSDGGLHPVYVQPISDRRLKRDLAQIEDAAQAVCSLTGFTYLLKGVGRRLAGLVSQDVQRVLPEAVSEDDGGVLRLDYNGVVALLVQAFKEVVSSVAEVNKRVDALNKRVDALERL